MTEQVADVMDEAGRNAFEEACQIAFDTMGEEAAGVSYEVVGSVVIDGKVNYEVKLTGASPETETKFVAILMQELGVDPGPESVVDPADEELVKLTAAMLALEKARDDEGVSQPDLIRVILDVLGGAFETIIDKSARIADLEARVTALEATGGRPEPTLS